MRGVSKRLPSAFTARYRPRFMLFMPINGTRQAPPAVKWNVSFRVLLSLNGTSHSPLK